MTEKISSILSLSAFLNSPWHSLLFFHGILTLSVCPKYLSTAPISYLFKRSISYSNCIYAILKTTRSNRFNLNHLHIILTGFFYFSLLLHVWCYHDERNCIKVIALKPRVRNLESHVAIKNERDRKSNIAWKQEIVVKLRKTSQMENSAL